MSESCSVALSLVLYTNPNQFPFKVLKFGEGGGEEELQNFERSLCHLLERDYWQVVILCFTVSNRWMNFADIFLLSKHLVKISWLKSRETLGFSATYLTFSLRYVFTKLRTSAITSPFRLDVRSPEHSSHHFRHRLTRKAAEPHKTWLEIMTSVLIFMQDNLTLFSSSQHNLMLAPCSILSDVTITMQATDTAVYLRRLSDCMASRFWGQGVTFSKTLRKVMSRYGVR